MSDSIVKFHDAHIRPPKGGWNYPIGGRLVTKHSESEILTELVKWQKNNAQFVSEETAKAEMWAYWCQREPHRCGGPVPRFRAKAPPPVQPRDRTPEVQGPPIWTFLNTLAAAWTMQLHDYFLHTIDTISVILECPVCRHHWQEIVRENPPQQLKSRFEVCQWVNKMHNLVNGRIGKPIYTYLQMVQEFGAPLS